MVVDDVTDLLFQRMQTDPPAGVSASPIADNVMTWYKTYPLTLVVTITDGSRIGMP